MSLLGILKKEVRLFGKKPKTPEEKELEAVKGPRRRRIKRFLTYGGLAIYTASMGTYALSIDQNQPEESRHCIMRLGEIIVLDTNYIPQEYMFPGLGLLSVSEVDMYNQDGETQELSDFLGENIHDREAIEYVRENIMNQAMMKYAISDKEVNPGHMMFEFIWEHFSSRLHYTQENEAAIELESGRTFYDSVQSFSEFVNEGYRGDCDDISTAMYVAFEIVREESARMSNTSSYWQEVSDYFETNQLMLISTDNHVANLIERYNDNILTGVDAIEPQNFGEHIILSVEEDGLVIVNEEESQAVNGIYSVDRLYGAGEF